MNSIHVTNYRHNLGFLFCKTRINANLFIPRKYPLIQHNIF